MPKTILVFKDGEEDKLRAAQNGPDYEKVIYDFDMWLSSLSKHAESTVGIKTARYKLREILNNFGINYINGGNPRP